MCVRNEMIKSMIFQIIRDIKVVFMIFGLIYESLQINLKSNSPLLGEDQKMANHFLFL